MGFSVSPEKALFFSKLSVRLIASWPPPLNASKLQLFLEDLIWWIAYLISSCTLVSQMYTFYIFRSDPARMIKCFCEIIAIGHTPVKMMVCKAQRSRIQFLMCELENFLKKSTPRDREVLQRYVDKCGRFYFVIAITIYSTAVAFNFGPSVLPQSLPLEVVYPFATEVPLLKVVLYGSQTVAIFQTASGVAIDCQLALTIWYVCARLEILAVDFGKVKNLLELNRCIREHQELLQYGDVVRTAVRHFASITTVLAAIGVCCGGLQLVTPHPPFVKIEFLTIAGICAWDMLVYAWPAENLANASEDIGNAVYNFPWVGKSTNMCKSLIIVAQRSQKPMLIGGNGIFPALSLSFYGTFLTTSFSYYTTLRAVTHQ